MPDFDSRTHTASCVNGVWTVTPRDLTLVKAEAKARIDHDAEHARLKYITPGAGQSLEYQHAADEATRYQATNGLGSYPMLQASVDAGEAATLAEAAVAVLQQEAVWASQIGPQIRKLRKAAKIAIDAATTIDQVLAATEVNWP